MSEFFGELYLRSTLPFLTPEVTSREVEYLRQAFEPLKVEGPIADLGCGHGRHAAPLTGTLAGRPLVGFDLDPLSLVERFEGFLAVRADLFHLPLREGSLAGAYAWYSTLFVFEDAQIAHLLGLLSRALKPGGRLVFHTVPYLHVASQPVAGYDGTLPDGSHLVEEAAFDPATGRDNAFRKLTTPGGEVLSGHFFIRYYPLPQLTRLLEGAGLTAKWIHGDLNGAPLTDTSTDLIVGVERDHG
ncbi:MAG: class I SAM-dependent methyltransferase [Myxococcaceae bacterium]